jgi:site-specific recombinase XerC
VATAALRFFYRVTLKQNWCMTDMIPAPKAPERLSIVLILEEVVRFLDCVAMRKHRAILTTCYAAGLRISEAVALTLPAIDSTRIAESQQDGESRGSMRESTIRQPQTIWRNDNFHLARFAALSAATLRNSTRIFYMQLTLIK